MSSDASCFGGQRPRALEGLLALPAELPDHPFEGHGHVDNLIFEVICPCGCDAFDVNALLVEQPIPPVMLTCSECGTRRICFDPNHDGYDGVVGNYQVPPPTSASRTTLMVDTPLWIRFEFPPELLEAGAPQPWRGREADLYSWFSLVALDQKTNKLRTVFDWDCA